MIITTNARIPLRCCKDLETIKEYLTIVNPEFTAKSRFGNFRTEMPDEFLCYYEIDGDDILLPRNFHKIHSDLFHSGKEEFVVEEYEVNSESHLPSDAKFIATLREYQEPFIDKIKTDRDQTMDLLIEAGCGTGKTLMVVDIIFHEHMKALILVPTYAIAGQWLNTIQNFTEGASCEIANPRTLQKLQEEKKLPDILIMSFDLFDARQLTFTDYFCKHWGIVALDEAHRTGAPSYQPVLALIPAYLFIAATATFRRNDGMHKVLEYFFGEKFTLANPFKKATAYSFDTSIQIPILMPKSKIPGGKRLGHKNLEVFEKWLNEQKVPYSFFFDEIMTLDLKFAKERLKVPNPSQQTTERLIITACLKRLTEYQQDNMFSTVDSFVARYVKRRRVMIQLLMHCLSNGRKILFISKRKDSLKSYQKYFERVGIKTGLIIGENSKDVEHLNWCRSSECRIVFGIYQIAKEGLDVDTVDTVLLEHPFTDIEQIAGRCTRILPDKKRSILLYPSDGYIAYQRMYITASKQNSNVVDFCTPMKLKEVIERID